MFNLINNTVESVIAPLAQVVHLKFCTLIEKEELFTTR